tara:strand:+ start:1497 stop:2312 length:816 start_codon:yes stop_codon:yes gene_type:complete
MKKEIHFQSSLPRSGSTLLQNIIGQNPNFYVTPTSGVLELLYSAREQYSTSPEFQAQDDERMKNGFLAFCDMGMQGFYNAITDKPIILDKSRGWGIHYGFLSTFIKLPKIICMIRDPRSIYSSMEKKFRSNPEKSKGIVNWATGQGVNIEARIKEWSNSPPVGLAFGRLKEIIDRGYADEILFVKFENLTSQPEIELARIYDYLEEDNFVHDFNNVEQITQEDDTVYGVYGDHKIKKVVKPLTDDYNQILGEVVSQNIYNSYRWFYEYFKY